MNNTLRSRQLNPCDHLFWKSRGYPERPQNWKQILIDSGYYNNDGQDETSAQESYYSDSESEYETDSDEYYSDDTESEYEENRLKSLQNNPNNDEYWRLRGFPRRPNDWRERIEGSSSTYKPSAAPIQASSTKQNPPKNKNEWWKNGKNRI